MGQGGRHLSGHREAGDVSQLGLLFAQPGFDLATLADESAEEQGRDGQRQHQRLVIDHGVQGKTDGLQTGDQAALYGHGRQHRP